jgi:choline dehydrogenase-like flavoprotein
MVTVEYSNLYWNGISIYTNTHTQLGTIYIFHTIQYPCQHRYRPALDRANLHILASAQTMRLIIDEDTKTVTGVVIRRGKNREELEKSADEVVSVVQHKGEVIVSAGALATPQILQLSGIGTRKMLESVGVKCVVDLPVGMNLQDHLSAPCHYSSHIPTLSALDFTGANIATWAKEGRGALQSCAVEALLFYNSGMNANLQFPLMDVQFNVVAATSGKSGVSNSNVRHDIAERRLKYLGSDKFVVMILPTLLHPESVGTVRLQSSNPLDHPYVYLNPLHITSHLILSHLVSLSLPDSHCRCRCHVFTSFIRKEEHSKS